MSHSMAHCPSIPSKPVRMERSPFSFNSKVSLLQPQFFAIAHFTFLCNESCANSFQGHVPTDSTRAENAWVDFGSVNISVNLPMSENLQWNYSSPYLQPCPPDPRWVCKSQLCLRTVLADHNRCAWTTFFNLCVTHNSSSAWCQIKKMFPWPSVKGPFDRNSSHSRGWTARSGPLSHWPLMPKCDLSGFMSKWPE